MGNLMAKSMDENRVKMMENQKAMMLKQRETMLAMEIAKARDRFYFYQGFYYTLLTAGTFGAIAKRNPAILIGPMIPTTWAFLFQYDMCYGNKMERIIADTDQLLMDRPDLFRPPQGSLLLDSIDEYDTLVMHDRKKRNDEMRGKSVVKVKV